MSSRRKFLQNTALAFAAPVVGSLPARAASMHSDAPRAGEPLTMGMAGFTFRNFNVDQTIAIMNRVGVTELSLKDFHLPLDSSSEKAKEVVGKFKAGGINIYAVGVIYMQTQAEVDRAFDYAAKVGVSLLVGVPSYDLLQYTEQKVKSTGIRIAIHNHGPEDKRYPGPKDVYDRIKNFDAKVGLCLDIGHALRAGADPARAVIDYAPRLFDLHIKDVSAAQPNAKAIEVGRGAINFPAFIKALEKINYKGKCSVEFEKDMQDPLAGIAESVGYFKGVTRAVTQG